MGAREKRSTETALDLLVNQVQTVWQTKGNVASLLSLDITGAFNRVVRKRLWHVLRVKGIPEKLAAWVETFMTDRSTTLVLLDWEMEEFPISAGIPQGSPFSPILFLFYTAELLDLCNNPQERLSASAFIDDTNLLAYGPSMEENCQILMRGHNRCLDWARRYGASFALEKYKLIHLSWNLKQFNIQAPLPLLGVETKPKALMRILGIWLNPRLNWGAYIKEIQKKMKTYTNALLRTTASIWGATFVWARQIYNAVIQPAIAYGAVIWHTPTPIKGPKSTKPVGPAVKLAKIQNKCLRAIVGVYKATPTLVLETKTFIPPLDLYLNKRLTNFRFRHKKKLVIEACVQI